jgi:Cof subfamily protein (haloacid dehalogenase superfamily)
MYKVIVSDLDGTLLNNEHHLSPFTRKVLTSLVNAGIKFILATGRHFIDVKAITDSLGMDIYLVTSNGAVVTDRNHQVIYSKTIPTHIAQELSELHMPMPDIATNIYTFDAWYVDRPMPEYLEFHKDSGFAYTLADLKTLDKQNITKFFFMGEHSDLAELEQMLNDRYGDQLHVTFSLPDCLEVMAEGVNKGAAIESILAQNHLPLTSAVAFGDGMNDYEMLAVVGLGVVMENAHERLKMALPDSPRAGLNDEDGVAHFLTSLSLV